MYPIHEARGGGPKSVHQLALLNQLCSRLNQTEKTTDLSSSREVDSRNIIRINFGEIFKKLDLSPSSTWYPSVSKASINDEEVNLRW